MGKRGPKPTHGCGTNAAHRRHLRNGETPCDACLEAHRKYQEANRRKRGIPARPEPKCGDPNRIRWHKARGEDCEVCRLAYNEAHREYMKTYRRRQRDLDG